MTNALEDNTTGLKNNIINMEVKPLSYVSTATKIQIEKDESNLKRYEILKEETFKHF